MQIRPLGPPLALALALTTALAACSSEPVDGPEVSAGKLVAGLVEGDLAGVPLDTTTAAEQFAAIIAPVADDMERSVELGKVTEDDDTATATLTWTWQLEGHEWTYDTTADLTRSGDLWRVVWSPDLVEPSLAAGEHLDTDTVAADRGDILGAGDQPLVTMRDVVHLGLDKSNLDSTQIAPSADQIARLIGVDVEDFVALAEAAGEKAYVDALVVRADDPRAQVPPEWAEIPGALVIPDRIPLPPTPAFAGALLGRVGPATAEIIAASGGAVRAGDKVGLSGLQARYDEQLRGVRGLRIEAVAADGPERSLHEVPATPGVALRTTLDQALQTRAEELLAPVKPASALVAIRPSDGAVLAAASGPGGGGLNTATAAQYAPGSTFKVVTSLALLRSGLTPESRVRCNARTVVDGKAFKNYDDFPATGLGKVSLRTALADSCNTAFINARDRIGDGVLAGAAAALGLGVDHDLGFPAYFGQVPAPAGQTEAAAALIGQGKVLASPMAMAGVAASVAAGHAVLPVLLPDHAVTQKAPRRPLTGPEAGTLRALMRAVVTEGSGSFLGSLGEVGAKTGTAEFGSGDPLPTHAWVIAHRGDLAVAVFVERGESGGRTAGPILQAFLS